ncbi:MAG TPA: glycosyltransferase family 2 protein [Nitrospirota bacterium]|nr:glycosyltransferase family 2 protein [Nitrospirota bacterium]
MKISIITAVLNNVRTIHDCINSIANQTYPDLEHIVIDGGSKDGTVDVIKNNKTKIAQFISEPDKGIYDALNKGIHMASGEIIGFLHADDFYANNKVIETVIMQMASHGVDSCYGDLVYVAKDDTGKIIRYWQSCPYQVGLFQKGWAPPHTTFFVKKKIYEEYGVFDDNFKIAGDYELMLRFLERYRISTVYIPEVLVKMRMGGTSNRNLWNLLIKTYEDYRAWTVNSLQRRFYTIPWKILHKLPQFFRRG